MNIHGFRLLKLDALKRVFDDMNNRATCELVYDNLDRLWITMLLASDQLLGIRANKDDKDWYLLDCEIIEALIMLRAMRNLGVETLYWCNCCQTINTRGLFCQCEDYEVDQSRFLLDFLPNTPTLHERLHSLKIGEVLEFTVDIQKVKNSVNSYNFRRKDAKTRLSVRTTSTGLLVTRIVK